MASRPLLLIVGPVEYRFRVYFNGNLIGSFMLMKRFRDMGKGAAAGPPNEKAPHTFWVFCKFFS